MKKIFIIFILIGLASCSKDLNIDNSSKDQDTNIIPSSKVITYDDILNISPEELSDYRKNISVDDIDLLGEQDILENPLLRAGKDFKIKLEETKEASISENVDGGIEYAEYEKATQELPTDLKREFDLQLSITDADTENKVPVGKIYLNGIKFGEFKDGIFNKNFEWPKGIEKFDIIIRTEAYRDGFITLSSLNLEGSLLLAEAKLKKLDINEKVSLEKKQILKKDNFSIEIPLCSLVNNSGNCYKGQVTAKIDFIPGESVNGNGESALNMRALTDEGEIVTLTSGGMAFTDFVTETGEILTVGEDKNIEITYKVSDEIIKTMKSTLMTGGNDMKEGYWIYDKNKNLWLQKDAEIVLDEKNNTWTAIVSEIY